MTVIVTDTGFATDRFEGVFCGPDALPAQSADQALDLMSDADPEGLVLRLGAVALIRVQFPSFADGRGFSIARSLRRQGYAGRLRAAGHVLSDQYAMARRAGFDEVEIDDALAGRQPQAEWSFRADWQAHDHRSRWRA